MGWGPSGVPAWLSQVLDDYSDHGRLDGHGVSFSLLSQHPRQEAWLQRLDVELRRRPYRRVSEHVGFMAAGSVYRSTPLPVPNCPEVLRLGRSQLHRIAERVGSPVGLENLATSLSPDDALQQGELDRSRTRSGRRLDGPRPPQPVLPSAQLRLGRGRPPRPVPPRSSSRAACERRIVVEAEVWPADPAPRYPRRPRPARSDGRVAPRARALPKCRHGDPREDRIELRRCG